MLCLAEPILAPDFSLAHRDTTIGKQSDNIWKTTPTASVGDVELLKNLGKLSRWPNRD